MESLIADGPLTKYRGRGLTGNFDMFKMCIFIFSFFLIICRKRTPAYPRRGDFFSRKNTKN